MGIERHTGALSEDANLLERAVQVRASLGVDRDDVSACFGKRLNIFLRFNDHEMDVDDAFGRRPNRLHDDRANSDVRHESAVHDIDVNPIGAGLANSLDFSLKAAKIGRKDGRCDSERLWGAGHGSSQAPQGHRVNDIRSLTAIVPAKDNGNTPPGRADERG